MNQTTCECGGKIHNKYYVPLHNKTRRHLRYVNKWDDIQELSKKLNVIKYKKMKDNLLLIQNMEKDLEQIGEETLKPEESTLDNTPRQDILNESQAEIMGCVNCDEMHEV